ncbi:hypothetical protein [Actinocrispum sp. NPDC049592]|uniref:hypothetical protein n=1 Tax=Actinocrispum sp. NPDC049592 TaxID=3154835 RepID=UPI003424070D
MNDIKRVLATAFEAQPPVRLDRAQVIESGRRRLWRRRMAMAGGTVLAVAAIVTTTVFVGFRQPQQLQVGTPIVTGSGAQTPPPSSAGVAQRLTKVLAESRIVPAGITLQALPDSGDALQFQWERNRYEAAADLVNNQGDEGTLFVMVAESKANDARPTCAPPNTCVQREFGGRSVQLTTAPIGSRGEVLLMAHTKLPDGVQIYAMTSNVSVKAATQHGKGASSPTTPAHLLTLDQLGQITGLAGLKL